MSQSQRKSRRVYDFPLETLLQFAYLRQDEVPRLLALLPSLLMALICMWLQAARALGVAPITLKRICQRRQIRWPYRTVKAQARRAALRPVSRLLRKPLAPEPPPRTPAPAPTPAPVPAIAIAAPLTATSTPVQETAMALRPLAVPREELRATAVATTMVSVLPRLAIPPSQQAQAPRTQEPMPSPVLRTPRHMRFRMHFRFGASR
ncbi:hypothetical protein P43SY_005415 [Pythium insidiosum]|uniref:RWP-RK domain-containing protein n=1 Tax=Pythium insidiosum TaxID=114742 RepID=A0AAD5LS14_PYTIN|nr:hypothetical protein P43SY_005415 [Pythium insidiosum]